MKENFNLDSVLEHVATGKTPVSKAKNMIEKHFLKNGATFEENPSPFAGKKSKLKFEKNNFETACSEKISVDAGENKDKLKNAFNKFKKSVNLDDLLKISTQLVQQISGNVPQKIQDKFSPLDFSAKMEGVESKFSIFRDIHVTRDNLVENNQVIGCQWFGVSLNEKCEVKNNKFLAMQLTKFSITQSDMQNSQLSLSRMLHVTLQEACFVKNKISLSTWLDTNITESDFNENTLSRSDFSGTVINSSRISKIKFVQVNFKDCEFDSCDIQGIEFEDCEFKDCFFSHIQAVSLTPIKISGCRFVGKQFSGCKSVEEFIAFLNTR